MPDSTANRILPDNVGIVRLTKDDTASADINHVNPLAYGCGGCLLWFFLFVVLATSVATYLGRKTTGDDISHALMLASALFTLIALTLIYITIRSFRLNRLAAQKRVRLQEEEQLKAQSLTETVLRAYSSSAELVSKLPTLIRDAESFLDRAEQEFSEGAFAPFWDAVERAADCLATFDQSIQRLTDNAGDYYASLKNRNHTFPSFTFLSFAVPDASSSVSRLKSIVRRAQKDFHFATIYEQRKTNMLLTNGFLSLSAAISNLGDMIHSSVADLRESISSDLARVVENQIAAQESTTETNRILTERADEQRLHEETEREMLDNIQRRKMPPIPHLRDGQIDEPKS